MRKYQIVRKPRYTATGAPGEWSFVAHGATYTLSEARDMQARIEARTRDFTRRLPI